jgi:hypothetical protein
MNPSLAALGLLAVSAAGCSSSGDGAAGPWDGGFPAAPYMTLESTSGGLSVELRTWPQPPTEGLINAQMTVVQADGGVPVDGLSVSIRPWMPAMNHGAVRPTVTPADGGAYVITNLDLFMGGEWQLQTSFSGPVEAYVAPEFEVP